MARMQQAVSSLVQVAKAALKIYEGSEVVESDSGTERVVSKDDFDALAIAFDTLDELSGEQPGCFMDAPAKAEWALRELLSD